MVIQRILSCLAIAILVSACGGSGTGPGGSGTGRSAAAAGSSAPAGGPAASAGQSSDPPPVSSAAPTADKATAAPATAGASVAMRTPIASGSPPNEGASTDAPPTEPASNGEHLRWARIEARRGPSAREDHTWTVDGGGTAAYLFGGRSSGDVYDDLWRYDLAADTWSRSEPAGPTPDARFGHTATWVEGVGLVVWSGQAGSTFFADVWAYDPARDVWRELPGGGDRPAARYGSCAALAADGRLIVSHGFTDKGRFDDTRAYDFAARSWLDVTPAGRLPVQRCLHDCLWTPDGRFLLFAGQTDGVPALGDLWALRPDRSWEEVPGSGPAPRQLYALASRDGEAFIFGGTGEQGGKLDDLWRLDLVGLAWSRLRPEGAAPVGRSGATLVADRARGRLLLFGGLSSDGTVDDLWALQGPAGH